MSLYLTDKIISINFVVDPKSKMISYLLKVGLVILNPGFAQFAKTKLSESP